MFVAHGEARSEGVTIAWMNYPAMCAANKKMGRALAPWW